MRILQVIQELRPGGAQAVTLSLLHCLERSGHDAAVATGGGAWAEALRVPRYDLPMLERRPERVLPAALLLRRAIRCFRPDLIHCHNPAMALLGAAATWRRGRPPALVTVHGVPEADYRRAAGVLRVSGLPVVGCGPGVTQALERNGVPVRCTVLNGVPPPPPPADRRRFATQWGLTPGIRLVVSVGRLVPRKRHDLAIDAVARLENTALAIIGDGPLEDSLREHAAQSGAAARVVLTGFRSDARALMAAADAVVLCPEGEGLPLTLLEGLASRTPVVATAVRGIRELVTSGVECLLCPPDDAASLARALDAVVSQPALGARLAGQAARTAERFSEDAMTRTYLDLYAELVRA